MSSDPDEILSRAIPSGGQAARSYLGFLVAEDRLHAAEAVAARLLTDPQPEDREPLAELCDRYLDRQMPAPAVSVWNALCASGLLPYSRLEPERGISLANPAFAGTEFGAGFNWRANTVPGIVSRVGSGRLAVFFSGKQPESAEPVWTWIPVVPGAKYILRFEYQTAGISLPSGLAWHAVAGDRDLGCSVQLRSTEWKEETLPFAAPDDVQLVRLRLVSSRAAGAVRIAGTLLAREMRLVMTP
jgi:hypothetical protein